jgi:Zn-dependent peptidase ImmA (M78 family)
LDDSIAFTGDTLSCTKQQTSSFTTIGKNIPKEVRIEIEANHFSAQLLMPSLEFKREINQFEPDLRAIFIIAQNIT